ncbi:MAG: hypothetical protein F6K09_26775 [Merismopedia sp. SIO2A8]|nr:hypothetical protein [Merismopedia sp. SIO2A8]
MVRILEKQMKMHPIYSEVNSDQKAYYLLEQPEDYPGLIQRQQRDRHFLLSHYPAFEPHASWSLFQTGDRYWVRRVEWGRSKRMF